MLKSENVINNLIKSLRREIANVKSFNGGQRYKKCSSETKCDTSTCKCQATGVLCIIKGVIMA